MQTISPENPSRNLHFVWLCWRDDLKWEVRSLKLPSRKELNLLRTLIFVWPASLSQHTAQHLALQSNIIDLLEDKHGLKFIF